jgi:pfkB family carbohydrate kinase
MCAAREGELRLQYDYTTVGHVTVDVLADGTRRPGGSAFYAGLQAARLGMRALIVTQGVAAELEPMLEPYRGELALLIVPAAATTTLQTHGSGLSRSQRLTAWAGEMPDDLALDTAILHLAPVARETPSSWRGDAAFVGLTPQGLVRRWPPGGGDVWLTAGFASAAEARAPHAEDGTGAGERAGGADDAVGLAARCDALVVSEGERASCARMIDASIAAGAAVAVTAGPGPTLLLSCDGDAQAVGVRPVERPVDDLGAGDVFAAAFFVMLHQGRPPAEAAAFANAAAAVRMLGAGAHAIGRRDAVDRRLRALEADR